MNVDANKYDRDNKNEKKSPLTHPPADDII